LFWPDITPGWFLGISNVFMSHKLQQRIICRLPETNENSQEGKTGIS
jgi:hypothetical protein